MAHPTRPPLRPSRHGKSPATDDIENSNLRHHHPNNTHAPVSTRRPPKATPLLALEHANDPADTIVVVPPPPAALARANSRKRPATAFADAPPDTRPPSKVTVTQPQSELIRTTNGVPAVLGIRHDDVSTPKSNGAAAGLTVPGQQSQDKRSLRSHDGGSRLKSDLSIYFANYDDIIADAPKAPGRPRHVF